MTTVMKFDEKLDIFQNIVVLYRNVNDELFIGNTYYYNGRGIGPDWMSVMYAEAMPEEKGILLGWNWLDENSPRVTLVPEVAAETGVEDFLYAHGLEHNWRSIDYVIVNNYQDIEAYCREHKLQKGHAIAFGIKN